MDISGEVVQAGLGSTSLIDGELAAKSVQLRYVSDRKPGISRERTASGFIYKKPDGSVIQDADELARIRALAVPPAWEDVWICCFHNGHIQATGRDARGRKQYRYHPEWRKMRDQTKYEHLLLFGQALPAIRSRVEADLAKPGLPREKVLAAVVRLMEMTLARVGNPEYARDNQSFGLTTLLNRHVRITRGEISLDFRAKHGIRHRSVVRDRKLARILKNCRDLPGSVLFQYIDEDGQCHSIDSGDVNDYLREISDRAITAKDFRTWAGTNLAVLALTALDEEKPTKKGTLTAIKQVAQQLGNTPAVCRKCYIHPAVFDAYLAQALRVKVAVEDLDEFPAGVWALERQVMRFLKTWAQTNLDPLPHSPPRRRSGGQRCSRKAQVHNRGPKPSTSKNRIARQNGGRQVL
jgi:DNA topoisomerase-1